MQSQHEYVLRTVEERGVQFIQLWFTDVLGIPKTFSITPAELENALDEGMTFDGSAIDGFSRIQEVRRRRDSRSEDVPDPAFLPDRARSPGSSATSPTSTARRSRAIPARCSGASSRRHTTRGFFFFAAPEIEYFYFADADPTGPPSPLDSARTSSSPLPTSRPTCGRRPSSPSRRWASPSSTRSTKMHRANTRSTCATPTRLRWRTRS